MGEKLGQRRRGGEKKEAPRYQRQGWTERQEGRPGGGLFSTAGGRAENVLISHNVMHCVISHYALCQPFTSFSFLSLLYSFALSVYFHSRVKGCRAGVCWGDGGGAVPEFCTADEPEEAASLPLRTAAKSPQESCA